jgi:hypothetical protein
VANVETAEEAQAHYREAAGRAANALTVADAEVVESASPEELGVHA